MTGMCSAKLRHSMLLFLAAVIWGVAFVAQSVGMDYVGPFTFICLRSFLGGVTLLPCIALLDRISKQKTAEEGEGKKRGKETRNKLLAGGSLCGLVLCAASCFQQIGIQHTTVGKAGFITAFYIIIVPVLGIFLGERCGCTVWLGVALAVGGLYFLCIQESLRPGRGDLQVLVCAFLFAVHILVIDYFAPQVDAVRMSCIQFFVCGILSGTLMLIFEKTSLSAVLNAWQPIVYAGVLSSGAGYTLQILGQKDMNPTVASLIMSLESVVSVLAGLLILGQILSGREILGCILMSAAIVLAQLPQRKPAAKQGIVREKRPAENEKM